MTDRIKDPLGVVAKWKQEESRYHFTGWDDTKYCGAGLLMAATVISPLLIIWLLIF